MLDQSTRTAILRLGEKGHGTRQIARALGISRGAVKDVLDAGSAEVPRLERREKAAAYRDDILALYSSCQGNLVRVHEELLATGATLSYQALTGFCRRHGIGQEEPVPAGRYHFAPGQEMQHDTSPHDVKLSGKLRRVQTASLVLCYSRMIFIQLYPRFTRFECKVFLTDALCYFGGAAKTCMVDNSSVIRLKGTGKEMVPVPEMAAFAERFHFAFLAHEVGDANRSARVEGPFQYVEGNFLAGREFTDWEHMNREAILWCDRANAKYSTKLRASRRELFAVDQPHLQKLPTWVPEVYVLHQRVVDLEGYVSLHTNRYSVPYTLMGRSVQVRETKDKVEINEGPRQVAEHRRVIDPMSTHITLAAHRPRRGELKPELGPPAEERALLAQAPELADYLAALKKRSVGRGTLAVRRLARLVDDYPRAPLLDAIATATQYGLYDLDRLERMVLRHVTKDYFLLPQPDPDDEPEGNDDG